MVLYAWKQSHDTFGRKDWICWKRHRPVSGSGKSSIVFDTIAAESQRQMNETYTAFIRGRLLKFEKPKVDIIENLSAAVIIDQTRLGGNARSTVGTISDMYSALWLLYSRIRAPHVGTASYFSFNDPKRGVPGMRWYRQGYEWDDSNPRIQLEPRGERGYIELRTIKRRTA